MLRRQGRELRRKALWIGGREDRYDLSLVRRAKNVLFRDPLRPEAEVGPEASDVEEEPPVLVRESRSNSSNRLQSACKTAPPATATVIAKGNPVSPNSRLKIFLRACSTVLESESRIFFEEMKERRAGPRESESARV